MIKYIGKQMRIDKGYSVRTLATKAKIAPSTIFKWEKGEHLPDLECLDIVACAVGVKPWQLIEFKGNIICYFYKVSQYKCSQKKKQKKYIKIGEVCNRQLRNILMKLRKQVKK